MRALWRKFRAETGSTGQNADTTKTGKFVDRKRDKFYFPPAKC